MVLRRMAQKRVFESTILWGPPGTGKTSLVLALSKDTGSSFCQLNATEAKVADVRKIIDEARKRPDDVRTFLFVDEIHRWTKAQQDVVLPVVEDGTIVLFGATTENPKFAVNTTILSRSLVLEVRPLDPQGIVNLIKRVKRHYKEKGRPIVIEQDAAKLLITRTSGDARKTITVLETAIEILSDDGVVTVAHISQAMPSKHIVFDAHGNDHYDLAHCYQEAIQNSDVDAALYWLGKWVASGEDPAYICRRMLITSFEDAAGNPFAQTTAMAACFATERTGLPECLIPMSLATCEIAMSKRNKSAYNAIKAVMEDVENNVIVHVPPELRAGTSGYVHAVKKRYLKGWGRDETIDEKKEKDKPEIIYAIGLKDGDSYGMCNGPTPDLLEMLAEVGEDGQYIIEFWHDVSREIYRWENGGWVEK